jgi:hypothetical protein
MDLNHSFFAAWIAAFPKQKTSCLGYTFSGRVIMTQLFAKKQKELQESCPGDKEAETAIQTQSFKRSFRREYIQKLLCSSPFRV